MRKGRAADILSSLKQTQSPTVKPSKIKPPSDGAGISSPLEPARLGGATQALLREGPGLDRLWCPVLVFIAIPPRAVPLCRLPCAGAVSPLAPAPLFPICTSPGRHDATAFLGTLRAR
ncbi:unnamed protein product [Coccothraustes coccothraustes]